MNSFHEALQTIAHGAGLAGLTPGPEGYCELIVADGLLNVYLRQAEESQLELTVRLHAMRLQPGLARALLHENARRRFGRFSLENGGQVVFGQRLELSEFTEAQLLRALDAFVREALRIEAAGSEALLGRAPALPSKGHEEALGLIRV